MYEEEDEEPQECEYNEVPEANIEKGDDTLEGA